jgi:CarD family transcriptional regulator
MLDLECFKVGDRVVYPAHGVGEIIGEEVQIVGGAEFRVFIISLPKDKVTLRVPVKRASHAGLRQLCSLDKFTKVFNVLQMKSRVSKGMWSKRAQEYEVKINSGNINSLAEVARDLHKNSDDPERSYSERIIYESALGRLAGEYAAIKGIELAKALSLLTDSLEERIFAA